MFSTDVEMSEFIRNNFKANKSSLSKRSPLFGVAFNDADYVVSPMHESTRLYCMAYSTWKDMVLRCLGDEYKKKRKCYANASIHSEWLSFMKFREWWIENSVTGWCIDKDLLSDSRMYSAENCIYVPQWLNLISTNRDEYLAGTGSGVHFDKSRGKFKASLSAYGKHINIGRYGTEKEAKDAYLNRKIEYINERKKEMDSIHPDIYSRVINSVISKN